MIRRPALSVLLVLTACIAGLVLSGRLRWRRSPLRRPAGRRLGPSPAHRAPRDQARRLAGQRAPACPISAASPTRAVGGVVNISSLQVVRTPNSPFANDPFFRYFFGDESELFGSREPRARQPRLGRRRLARRLHRHQQPRRRRQRARGQRRPARQARGARQDRRHRSDDRHRACSRSTRPASRSCRGAIRRS